MLHEGGPEVRRRQVTAAREEARQQETDGASAPPAPSVPVVFRMTYGKHTGKTLAEIRARDPKYITYCVMSKHLENRPTLREALEADGTLQQEITAAEEMRQAQAK